MIPIIETAKQDAAARKYINVDSGDFKWRYRVGLAQSVACPPLAR